jgi:hypothetical protein
MFELIRAGSPDTSIVFALVDSIGAVQNEIQKEWVAHMLAAGSIFTPDQRQRFFEMFESRMHKRWGPGKHPGRGMRHGGRPPFPPPFDMTTNRDTRYGDEGRRYCANPADIRVKNTTQGGK